MDDYEKKITIITVIIAILALILATLMIITIGKATKTAVSQAYDLNCLTGPIERPLEECRSQQ